MLVYIFIYVKTKTCFFSFCFCCAFVLILCFVMASTRKIWMQLLQCQPQISMSAVPQWRCVIISLTFQLDFNINIIILGQYNIYYTFFSKLSLLWVLACWHSPLSKIHLCPKGHFIPSEFPLHGSHTKHWSDSYPTKFFNLIVFLVSIKKSNFEILKGL